MTYIAFIRRRALMLSSSHKPGCMAAIPASQSCRVRRVLCMAAAHSSCVQPAAARRACRASGEKAARCLRRFGWLGIVGKEFFCLSAISEGCDVAAVPKIGNKGLLQSGLGFSFGVKGANHLWEIALMAPSPEFRATHMHASFNTFGCGGFVNEATAFADGCFNNLAVFDQVNDGVKCAHFDSLAPESRGAVVSDFAGMSELYTRIPCVQLPFVGKFEINDTAQPALLVQELN